MRMSRIYLFDKERTGRLPFSMGNSLEPKILWSVDLPQYPISGPESTAVLDNNGNLYFGCHNGCIYSLTNNGDIRWQFVTKGKVYSSPLFYNERLYFCCNGFDVICLSLTGKLIWSFRALEVLKGLPKWKKVINHFLSYLVYDYHSKSIKLDKVTAWCSPNVIEGKAILVNLYGVGVIALDPITGQLIWQRSLGIPWNHLAGVAIFCEGDRDRVIAVSQSNKIFSIDGFTGEVIWKKPLRFLANSWSNPSIDLSDRGVYCSTSIKNNKGWVFKFDYNGNLLWKLKISGGIRGAITISTSNFVLVPSLNGCLYFVSKGDGTILRALCIGDKIRGLWTSAILDVNNDILINVKTDVKNGALLKLNSVTGEIVWKLKTGKALCSPVVDRDGNIYIGTWSNSYMKIES